RLFRPSETEFRKPPVPKQSLGTRSACLLFIVCASVFGAAAAPPPAGSELAAVYFGPGGPVRVTFHVTLDGRPVETVWAEVVDALFTFCDTNGDGVLDSAERAVFAPPRQRMRATDVAPADSG